MRTSRAKQNDVGSCFTTLNPKEDSLSGRNFSRALGCLASLVLFVTGCSGQVIPTAAPTRDAIVVMQKGRIVAAGARSQVKIPADAKSIDVQGASILPGFINAHVHQGFSASNGLVRSLPRSAILARCCTDATLTGITVSRQSRTEHRRFAACGMPRVIARALVPLRLRNEQRRD